VIFCDEKFSEIKQKLSNFFSKLKDSNSPASPMIFHDEKFSEIRQKLSDFYDRFSELKDSNSPVSLK